MQLWLLFVSSTAPLWDTTLGLAVSFLESLETRSAVDTHFESSTLVLNTYDSDCRPYAVNICTMDSGSVDGALLSSLFLEISLLSECARHPVSRQKTIGYTLVLSDDVCTCLQSV